MVVISPDHYVQTIQSIQAELSQVLFAKYLSFNPMLTVGADLFAVKVYVVLDTAHGRLQFSRTFHPIMMRSNLSPDYTAGKVVSEILKQIEVHIEQGVEPSNTPPLV